MDEYCERIQKYPTFVKMDIEGSEIDAIKGIEKILAYNAPKLVIEVHPYKIRERGNSPQDVVTFVLNKVPGYRVYRLEHYRDADGDGLTRLPEKFTWGDSPEVLYFSNDESNIRGNSSMPAVFAKEVS